MLHLRNSTMRPAGQFTFEVDGKVIAAGDTVACVHCGCQWTVVIGSGRQRDYCDYHNGPTCGSPACSPLCCNKGEPGLCVQHHHYPAWYLREKAIRDAARLQWVKDNPGKVIVP